MYAAGAVGALTAAYYLRDQVQDCCKRRKRVSPPPRQPPAAQPTAAQPAPPSRHRTPPPQRSSKRPKLVPPPSDPAPWSVEQLHKIDDDFAQVHTTHLNPGAGQALTPYDPEQFTIATKPFDKGAYASIYQATEKSSGKLRVVRSIQLSAIRLPQHAAHTWGREYRGALLHASCQHPQIVRAARPAVIPHPPSDIPAIHQLQEHIDGGCMFDWVTGQTTPTSNPFRDPKQCLTLFDQMVQSVAYLHGRHIVHRDLKPENFLINKEHTHVSLTDFGLSHFLLPGQILSSWVGTAEYLSPEMIHKESTHQSDIWSLGICLRFMHTNTIPFDAPADPNQSRRMQRIMNTIRQYHAGGALPQPPPGVHYAAPIKRIVEQCLQRVPTKRPTAPELRRLVQEAIKQL